MATQRSQGVELRNPEPSHTLVQLPHPAADPELALEIFPRVLDPGRRVERAGRLPSIVPSLDVPGGGAGEGPENQKPRDEEGQPHGCNHGISGETSLVLHDTELFEERMRIRIWEDWSWDMGIGVISPKPQHPSPNTCLALTAQNV